MRHKLLGAICFLAALSVVVAQFWQLPLDQISLPPDFEIELYSSQQVLGARHMTLGLARDNTTIVYVSSNLLGSVTALVDLDSDGLVDTICSLLEGLENPNGIVWHNGSLYVQETPRLTRYDGVDFAVRNNCNASLATATVLNDKDFPPQASHAFRALALGPDEKLYLSVAAPFNVDECTGLYCTLQRINLDGTGMETFASGVRNVGGIAWSDRPELPEAYFSVLERDMMGDNAPDDLVASLNQTGGFFGFPYCHSLGTGSPYERDPGPGDWLPDDTLTPFGLNAESENRDDEVRLWCEENALPPVQALGPHVSPLGLTFYPIYSDGLPAQKATPWPQNAWPEQYRGRLFVAEHGSWNRREPIGYRIAMVQVDAGGVAVEHEVFAEGWLQGGRSWGRPVGLLVMPDGSMLVAGDAEGAVYRISYTGGESTETAPERELSLQSFSNP